jgi:hypothetical protein
MASRHNKAALEVCKLDMTGTGLYGEEKQGPDLQAYAQRTEFELHRAELASRARKKGGKNYNRIHYKPNLELFERQSGAKCGGRAERDCKGGCRSQNQSLTTRKKSQ